MQTPDRNDKVRNLEDQSEHTNRLPSPDEDPELEREFQELAQWMLEVYLYKRLQQRKAKGSNIDIQFQRPTI